MSSDGLSEGIAELALAIDPARVRLFSNYMELIAKWNKVYNLTAIRDPGRMVVEHVLDSLAILPWVTGSQVLDIGSGAGLPGIPLAIARPQWSVTLIDSSHKKATFLRQAVIDLALENVDVVCERVEQFHPGKRFDTVVSRAFAETQHFARVAAPRIGNDGVIVAMKGLYPDEELAQLPNDVRLREVIELRVPGLPAKRTLIIMTKA
jgi:16S rRNA (guanine527-N7)-methyltransferase